MLLFVSQPLTLYQPLQLQASKLTHNINKYKMLNTLTILIRLLVPDGSAQQLPFNNTYISEFVYAV